MSGANAISGITIVGALMGAQYVTEDGTAKQILAIAAIALAMVNVIGGFMVTDRMLAMFATKKKGGKK
jgi:NAD(P) transhydrogenase subunit alpha